MNDSLDQSRFFQIGQPGGQRRRAHVAESASELVEPDGPVVRDQAQQPESVAPADQFRQWGGRTQAVGRG